MSTGRDVTRIVRSWLDEGVTVLPDRVLDHVLDRVPSTPQRRLMWAARRFVTMNTFTRFGLAAAAVIVAAAVGIGLYGNSVSHRPEPTPSPVNPLVGTWLAPEVTCVQEIATIEAAGYTAEQITSVGFDPTCAKNNIGAAVSDTNQYSVVFDGLPAAATIRSATIYDHGAVDSPQAYSVTGDSTVEFGNRDANAWAVCLTFHYAIVGDELTINSIDPRCPGTAVAPLLDQIALTAIFEGPFTRQR